MKSAFIKELVKTSETKIVMIVLDGLGGLPYKEGLTELEAARTPNLDDLAKQGLCGLHEAVAPGVTPGSGPGHLGIFGYDPTEYQVGRGVLAALGIDFDLGPDDVAARGNFCTIDEKGLVQDRRAGRINSEMNAELCALLRGISLPGAELSVQTVKDYRFLVVLRGSGLQGEISDTDPQETGMAPFEPAPLSPEAAKTARIAKDFVAQAGEILSNQRPANMVLLRGFSKRPQWPLISDVFGLRSAAVADYPMYRGLAKLIGMEILDAGSDPLQKANALRENWGSYDFFFVHVKPIDSAGEDGDFERKVKLIENFDSSLPSFLSLEPDVVVVTGDHSTPALMKSHSWHPVPTLLWSKFCRSDSVDRFGERTCATGGLGPRFPAVDLMPLALANAGRLEKFGA